MITFTVPTPYFAVSTVVAVDRDPTLDATIRRLEQKASDYLLDQSRLDGINAIEERFSFCIANRENAYIQSIHNYFKSLKGTGTVLFTFPGPSTKKVVINSWSIIMINALYSKIDAEAELVFL